MMTSRIVWTRLSSHQAVHSSFCTRFPKRYLFTSSSNNNSQSQWTSSWRWPLFRRVFRVARTVSVLGTLSMSAYFLGQVTVIEDPRKFEESTKLALLNGYQVEEYLSFRENQSLKILALKHETRACTFVLNENTVKSVQTNHPIWTGARTAQRLFGRLKRSALKIVTDQVTELRNKPYLTDEEAEDLEIWEKKKYNLENPWTITVVDSDTPNAFVHGHLPRHIFITQGLLSRMHNLDSQIALVLGHELSHFLLDHHRDSMFQSIVIRGLAILLTALIDPSGGLGGFLVELFLPVLTSYADASTSQVHELEADQLGLEICSNACFDPRQAISMFATLKSFEEEEIGGLAEGGTLASLFGSHPLTRERYENALEQLPEAIEIYRECSWLYRKYVELIYGTAQREHPDVPHPRHSYHEVPPLILVQTQEK